jgi:dTDP-4-amino-4,6-dideoxygalactose transaminase
VILTNSGTSALLACYWVLRDKYRKLSVDPYTFPATYQPARLLNYEINFKRMLFLKHLATTKNELYTITHLYGQPNELVKTINKSVLIEDACQSFGAELNRKKVGTFGLLGCYSFYPTKTLHTCGHGGAVVTDNKDYYEKLKVFIESGRNGGKLTENVALNLRFDEVKAEFLLDELKDYDKRTDIQRDIAKELIPLIPGSQPFLEEQEGSRHIFSTFNIILNNRDKFIKHMKNKGIETKVYYDNDVLPVSVRDEYEDITSSIVSIPCRWNLTMNEISTIRKALEEFFI